MLNDAGGFDHIYIAVGYTAPFPASDEDGSERSPEIGSRDESLAGS